MPTQCLASTGSNLLAVLGIGFVLAVIGIFLLRTAKGRAAVMVLVLVGGGLLFSQATSKPASAACVASSATTMPAPTTTSTTSTTSSTTTTTTAPATGFTFKFNFQPNGIDEWNHDSCSNFTATIKVTGEPGAGTTLVNANSSFPTTLFQSVPVPVTASTNYTVTYSWSCTSDPTSQFAWGGSATSNIPPPVDIGSINVSPVSSFYTWSSSAAFTTGPDVSAPTGIQITYTIVPI